MKLRKILAGAMAFVMVAGSLLVAPVEAKAANVDDSKVYNASEVIISETEKTLVAGNEAELSATIRGLLVDGSANWNSGGGDQFLLKNDFDVTVEFYNDAFIKNDSNWSNFVMEIFGGADTKGITLRADAYGWTYGEGTQEPTYTPVNYNWDVFRQVDNAVVSVNVKKASATTVDISIKVGETTIGGYTVTYAAGVPSEMRLQVGADGGKVWIQKFVDNSSSTLLVDKTIAWESSDLTVATVDANGKVTAVAAGSASIKAKCDGAEATCAVTVVADTNAITAIDVTTDKTEVKVGQTAQLSVTYTAEKPDKDITDDKTVSYTSSDETIATVDATGKVTAVKPGKVTITASVLNGTITDTIEITVPVVPVTNIGLAVSKTDLDKGDVVNIITTINPTDTTEDKTITWTSSNEKVATVDANGTVTAVGGGNATITATVGTIKASLDFKVTEVKTVVKKTTLEDMTIGDFLSVVSKGVQLKKGHTYTITFDSVSPNAVNNWETPSYVIYTSDEGAFNVGNWKELFLCRADLFGWPGGVFDNNTLSATFPSDYIWATTYPADWAAWLAECKAGTKGTITAKYDGLSVVVTYEIAGAKTVVTIPHTSSEPVYLSLTGEKSNLSKIEVADEYVQTVTGTGDFSMALPILLIICGGAAVIVASKKRFA